MSIFSWFKSTPTISSVKESTVEDIEVKPIKVDLSKYSCAPKPTYSDVQTELAKNKLANLVTEYTAKVYYGEDVYSQTMAARNYRSTHISECIKEKFPKAIVRDSLNGFLIFSSLDGFNSQEFLEALATQQVEELLKDE